jgi:hypothetical protein
MRSVSRSGVTPASWRYHKAPKNVTPASWRYHKASRQRHGDVTNSPKAPRQRPSWPCPNAAKASHERSPLANVQMAAKSVARALPSHAKRGQRVMQAGPSVLADGPNGGQSVTQCVRRVLSKRGPKCVRPGNVQRRQKRHGDVATRPEASRKRHVDITKRHVAITNSCKGPFTPPRRRARRVCGTAVSGQAIHGRRGAARTANRPRRGCRCSRASVAASPTCVAEMARTGSWRH